MSYLKEGVSREGQGHGTRARLRRGNDEIGGKLPLLQPIKSHKCRRFEEIMSEGGAFVEECDGVSCLGAEARVGADGRGRWNGRGGHRGWGGGHDRGRG